MHKIILKPKREESLRRFHPWIFSGAVRQIEGSPSDGDIVEVFSSGGDFLAVGHYQPDASIAIRVLSFTRQLIDKDFWKAKLQQAFELRRVAGLTDRPDNNVYRLVHGEGDGLPGLIVDIYHKVAVIQAHSMGMYRLRELFADLLLEIYDSNLRAVYDKSEKTVFDPSGQAVENAYLYGATPPDYHFTEYGNVFEAGWESGQKTGFFIDQRENRLLVEKYAKGKTVLNMFGYTGAFSVYAIRGGAKEVHTVDSSQKAMEAAGRNVRLNFPHYDAHHVYVSDCFEFMNKVNRTYDLVIVDPPAFAKNHHALKNALQAYRRLNAKALSLVNPGGVCFTFSCSQIVSKDQFRSAIFSAALLAGRRIRILHQLTQPADHPVNIFHPEGEYLKGLALYVE